MWNLSLAVRGWGTVSQKTDRKTTQNPTIPDSRQAIGPFFSGGRSNLFSLPFSGGYSVIWWADEPSPAPESSFSVLQFQICFVFSFPHLASHHLRVGLSVPESPELLFLCFSPYQIESCLSEIWLRHHAICWFFAGLRINIGKTKLAHID